MKRLYGNKRGAAKREEKYGPDYHAKIGSRGGKNSSGQWKEGSEEAREAGRKGGKRSKRLRLDKRVMREYLDDLDV